MTGMQGTLAEAKKHLHRVVEQLELIRWQLLGIQHSLPESSAGLVRLQDAGDEQDGEVTLRSIIQCILSDSLETAIRDLKTAATAQPDPDTTWEPPVV